MTEVRDINNLLAWSLQAGVLVAIAGVGAGMFRLRVPKAKLLYWQLTLAACLALPFVRAWKQETIVLTNTLADQLPSLTTQLAAQPASIPFGTLVVYLIGLVSIVRLGWLAAGLVRMRGYRLRAVPLPPQPQWGIDAELRVSKDVTGPVTFGFVDPVILLPADFRQMDKAHQEAILCHEFLHVRRRDWLFTVGEELIRTALWFHPAIWWALGEVQLAREEAVDQEAIGITRSRDKYVDALLAVAGAATRPDLAAASAFLRRRHLKQRVVSILQEVQMSRTKIVSSFTASVVVLVASCWLITGAIPLSGAPQLVSDGPGVAVDTGGATLMHRSAVVYPDDAAAKRIEGTVAVLVKLDGKGNVADASVVSGPEELRKAVLQSVLNWHFTSDTANSTRQIAVSFRLPANSVTGAAPTGMIGGVVPPPGRGAQGLVAATVSGLAVAGPGTLAGISVRGLSDDQTNELLAKLPVHEGDSFTPEFLGKVFAVVHAFDEHLNVTMERRTATEFVLVIAAPQVVDSGLVIAGNGSNIRGMLMPAPPPPPPPPPLVSTSGRQPQRIGGAVMQSQLLSQEKAVYPPLAKAARVQGTVRFEVLIGIDGHVQNLQLMAGPPLLVSAAMTAVQQWAWKPTLLNGNPVEVVTTVDVNFTLTE
jgi:TonB family protein